MQPVPHVLKTKVFKGMGTQGTIYDFAKSLTDDEQLPEGPESKSDGQVKLLKNEEKRSFYGKLLCTQGIYP